MQEQSRDEVIDSLRQALRHRESADGALGEGDSGRTRPSSWSGNGRKSPAGRGDSDYQKAKAAAFKYLAMRDHSRHELGEKLLKKEFPRETVTLVLDRLEASDLLDDARFARTFARAQHQSRGLAPRALAQELKRKGVDREQAAQALEQFDDDAQYRTARALVEKKAASSRGLERQRRVRRLVGLLARKGYPSGMCFKVVGEVLRSEEG